MKIISPRQGHERPAIGKCECGNLVTLKGFSNACQKCGQEYNVVGQKLAPRSQWGEDTDEDFTKRRNTR